MVAEEVTGGNDEVLFQFRAEKLDKKVCDLLPVSVIEIIIMLYKIHSEVSVSYSKRSHNDQSCATACLSGM